MFSEMLLFATFFLAFISHSVHGLSCYTCNSTGFNGNDCSEPLNRNTFRPVDCINSAVQQSFWDKWNIFARLVEDPDNINQTHRAEMERFFWRRPGSFDWNKWNIFARMVNNETDSVSDVDKNQMERFFWPKATNFDWNRWKVFSNMVESFNDTYGTETRDMENFSWLKPSFSRNYQCVTVEKTYSYSRVVERYCTERSQYTNHCSRLSNQAGSAGYALTRCLLCEYDGCNSSVSFTLSFTLAFIVILFFLAVC